MHFYVLGRRIFLLVILPILVVFIAIICKKPPFDVGVMGRLGLGQPFHCLKLGYPVFDTALVFHRIANEDFHILNSQVAIGILVGLF